jgi:hypothetical protein
LTLRRPAIALAAVAAALAVLHLVLVLPVHGFLLSDTTGYLANARWLGDCSWIVQTLSGPCPARRRFTETLVGNPSVATARSSACTPSEVIQSLAVLLGSRPSDARVKRP